MENQKKDTFADYLDIKRAIKIILVFALFLALVVLTVLTSPLENKGFLFFSGMLMFCLAGVGMIAYTWADFVEWKKLKNTRS